MFNYDRIQSERDSIHGKSNKRKRYISSVDRCIVILWMNVIIEKFTRWLCENHHVVVILLPEFKTKGHVVNKRVTVLEKSTLKLRDKCHIIIFASNTYFTNPTSILGPRSSSALH